MKIPACIGRLVLSFCFLQGPAAAEDIDLFVHTTPALTDVPNVLFVIDNAANFDASTSFSCTIAGAPNTLNGQVGGIEQCALYQVIDSLPADSVNIGIMVYNANNVTDYLGNTCPGSSSKPGGCLVYPMQPMSSTNKTTLLDWIRQWRVSGGSGLGYIKANSEATGASLQEAWAYFNGRTGLSGTSYATAKPDTSGCGNNYVIFIGNSYKSSGSPGDATGSVGPKDALDGTNPTSGMNTYPIATEAEKQHLASTITTSCGTATLGSPHEEKGYYADEWTRYMDAHDISTYTIGVLGGSCRADYAALLTNMASLGGGRYFPTTDFESLTLAIQTALSDIMAVNSVFASVSLPVSVNTEGTYLNQVFIGMFRPDGSALPRWMGNLKQYRIGMNSAGTDLELQDAQTPAQPAISAAGTGFIESCAVSYWTPVTSTPDGYWTNLTEANCSGYPASSDMPDGNIVEKGAAGYILRGSPSAESIARDITTCNDSCGATLATLSTSISKAALGDASMTDEERANLINWARGQNNAGDESYVAATAMRPSVHGDVIHSQPVAINFGTDAARKVIVFYGTNDGVLRAINGNRSDAITGPDGSVNPGGELWAFIPPEFYSQIQRLRDDSTPIKHFGSTVASALPKPYGLDGPITSYQDASTAWIFAGMRRGGRMIYSFDVSHLAISSPAVPQLKWRFGKRTSLAEILGAHDTLEPSIGQTWSAAVVLKAAGYGAGRSPLLIIGGGYDPCEDNDPNTCSDASHTKMGNHVFLIDADLGHLERTFDTDRAVVADVVVISDPDTGYAKWAYVADLGGNLYRISGVDANTPIEDTAPSSWTITKIASLGCDDTSACSANRKFMFRPDIVKQGDGYILLLGSGDREKPLSGYSSAYGVVNYFFGIEDHPADAGWLSQAGTCSGVICLGSLHHAGDTSSGASSLGWYLSLEPHEQVVTSAITVYGTTTFSTHIPVPPSSDSTPGSLSCTSTLGTAKVYNINYIDASIPLGATALCEEVAGGGLPPSPVAGKVILDDGAVVPFIIGASDKSSEEVKLPKAGSAKSQAKGKIYWYIRR